MAVSETTATLADPTYGRDMGRGKRPTARRTPAEYEAIWRDLYGDALARAGEPNAARYAATQELAAIEAEDTGRVVGSGDYETYL